MNTDKSKDNLLVVTIDTEEDNWGQYRQGISCDNIREIPKLQTLFSRYGIRPTFLVSYQVCLHEPAVELLNSYLDLGICEIGAHLHPWNTPPEDEELILANSFLGNLPYDLQLRKLATLTSTIEEKFGRRPIVFRTGRWGLGPNTVDALLACGYRIDSSVTPTFSWAKEGGPVFPDTETDPYPLYPTTGAAGGSILEIPATIGFNRWPPSFWSHVYNAADHPLLAPLHLIGGLNRTRLLQKIWLSPEGYSAEKMITLAKLLLRRGKRLLDLSFHSNTLLPGLTPFVRTEAEALLFYRKLERLFAFLQKELTVQPVTLSEAGDHYQFPRQSENFTN